MTTPKGGSTFGKIVPRQEKSSLNTLGWSRTIMLLESSRILTDLHMRSSLCQYVFYSDFTALMIMQIDLSYIGRS